MATLAKKQADLMISGTNLELAEIVHYGLPAATLQGVASELGIGILDLAETLQLARRTVTRRLKQDKRLTPAESEKILRVKRLLRIAQTVFESKRAAYAWFLHPLRVLGERTPLAQCSSEPGGREVELVLGRIDHGVIG